MKPQQLIVICLFIVAFHCFIGYGFDLTILHTGDTRSYYFASDTGLGACSYEEIANTASECFGSLARRGVFVEQVRQQGGNVLLVDSGDIESGGLNLNVSRGALIKKLYSDEYLNYDAINLGPRDFDLGIDVIENLVNGTYKVIGTTLTVPAGSEIANEVVKSHIKEYPGGKVGIISASSDQMMLEGKIPPGFNVDPDQIVLQILLEIVYLSSKQVENIILLSKSSSIDIDIDYLKKIPYIDVIVASYKGRYFNNDEDPKFNTVLGEYPYVVETSIGKSLIVSPPNFGVGIGRLDVTFTDGKIEKWSDGSNTYFLDGSYADFTQSNQVSQLGKKIYEESEEIYNQIAELSYEVLAHSESMIQGDRTFCRRVECTGGNLIADSFRSYANSDIGFVNSGGIRANIPSGDVTLGQLTTMFPFQNTVTHFTMKGRDIVNVLIHSVAEFSPTVVQSAQFLQTSGLKYAYNIKNPLNDRITDVQVLNINGKYDKIDFDKNYTVATVDFLLDGGDGYNFQNATDIISSGPDALHLLIEHVQNQRDLNLKLENRISQSDDESIFRNRINNARVKHRIPIAVVTFILMLAPILISILLVIKREHAVVVIASPFFCHLIDFGALLVFLGLILYIFVEGDAGCMLLPWFVTIGFSVMYGCLFAKTWRIHSIFSRQRKMKITKKPINNKQLFTVLGLMIFIDIIVLAIWQGLSPLKNEILPTNQPMIYDQVCRSENGLYFFITILIIKALLMVWGMYLVYLTRHVDSDFRESTYIGFIIYAVFITLVVIITVGFIISSDNSVVLFLICVAVWVVTAATIFGLFIPKFVEIFQQPDLLWENYFTKRASTISNRTRGSVIGSQEAQSNFHSTYASDVSWKKDLKKMKKKEKMKLLDEMKDKEKSLAKELETTQQNVQLITKSLEKKK